MWIRYKQKHTRKSLWQYLLTKHRETSTKTLWKYAGLGAVGVVLSGLLTFQMVQYRLRTSDFNILALQELSKHSKVLDLIGEPVKAGYVYSRKHGSMKKDDVDCVIPVYGSNVEGLIKYQAKKLNGEWVIRRMEFTFLDPAGGVICLVKNSTDIEPVEASSTKEESETVVNDDVNKN